MFQQWPKRCVYKRVLGRDGDDLLSLMLLGALKVVGEKVDSRQSLTRCKKSLDVMWIIIPLYLYPIFTLEDVKEASSTPWSRNGLTLSQISPESS